MGPQVEIISSGDYPNEEQFVNLNVKNSKPASEMNFDMTDNLVQTDTDETRQRQRMVRPKSKK